MPASDYYQPPTDWGYIRYQDLKEFAAVQREARARALAEQQARQREQRPLLGVGGTELERWRIQQALDAQRRFESQQEADRSVRDEGAYYRKTQFASDLESQKTQREAALQAERDARLADQEAWKLGAATGIQEDRDWRLGNIDLLRRAQQQDYQGERDQFAADTQAERDAMAQESALAELMAREGLQQRRDVSQAGLQAERDARLAGYDSDRALQNAGFQGDRDQFMSEQDMLRDQGRFSQQQQLERMQGQNWISRQMAGGVAAGKLEYSPQQLQELDRIDVDRSRVEQDETLTNSQRATAHQMLDSKEARVRSAARPRDPSREKPGVEESVRSSVHWDGGAWGKGQPWVIDPKSGMPQIARGYKAPTDDTASRLKVETHQQDLQLKGWDTAINQQLAINSQRLKLRTDRAKALGELTDPTSMQTPEQRASETASLNQAYDQAEARLDSLEASLRLPPQGGGGRSPVSPQGLGQADATAGMASPQPLPPNAGGLVEGAVYQHPKHGPVRYRNGRWEPL